MRDIWNGVHVEDGDVTMTDNDTLTVDEEECKQLQHENDFLRAQLAEASLSSRA